ncbi:hypothetical protein CLU79DRAFT_772919 [Phycomyces nitens]|nr:hypothetical protein CLU79DRAFT_772919 [Phycomyces nitens]
MLLQRCPSLTRLELQRSLLGISHVLSVLRYCCPLLQDLVYQSNRYYEPSRDLDDQASPDSPVLEATDLVHIPPSLSILSPAPEEESKIKPHGSLRQVCLRKANGLTDEMVDMVLSRPSDLEILDLYSAAEISDKALRQIVTHEPLSTLRKLCLHGCTGLSEQMLLSLLKRAPNLVDVDLSGLATVTDNILAYINGIKSLERIDLSECSAISDRPVRVLVDKHHNHLKELNLKGSSVSLDTLVYSVCKIKRGSF